MYHYLFTNDLRISTLQETLKRTGNAFITDSVPSAIENKSENNNMLTIGFYFNLTKTSNCAAACANNDTRDVVLNFIKKFQFPNPRTPESLAACLSDGISVAPLRLILQVLYIMNMVHPSSAHLSREEILNFIFYNSAVAKNRVPDIIALIEQIIEFRRTGVLPDTVEKDNSQRLWKHEDRQIREMTKVLTWSGCAAENDEQQIYIHHDNLTNDNKAALFDILNYREFWVPSATASFAENKESYQKYMDIPTAASASSGNQGVDLGKLSSMKNKDFIFACLEILKEHKLLTSDNLNILTSKELCLSVCGFPSYPILMKVDLEKSYTEQCYFSGNHRYYPEQFAVGEDLYYVCNNWYPEQRKSFIKWFASLLHGATIPSVPLKMGENIILYGVPGCGKSYKIRNEYCNDETFMERVVFHPDYSYSDFVGQILPVNKNGNISYPFIPGPFTRIMEKAVNNPSSNYYLIIEELNRGNAPAIFGDIFQLLDRKNGESEFGINNADIAKEVYGNENQPVKIPANLFIIASMNTADQNVFTLDTAFKRRWKMRSVSNDISKCFFANNTICDTSITWASFLQTINEKIVDLCEDSIGSEDKRLGAFFLRQSELSDVDSFSEKILMYLWNDAFKYDHDKIFKQEYRTLEQIIEGFKKDKFAVFVDSLKFDTDTTVQVFDLNETSA